MMDTLNVNGAILTDKAISEIKCLQDPVNSMISAHKESIAELTDFLISIRQYIDMDKNILDHCESLKCIRKTLESCQAS